MAGAPSLRAAQVCSFPSPDSAQFARLRPGTIDEATMAMTTSITKPPFGERLKALILECGLNQSSLARRSGVERTLISRIIAGKAKPRPEQIGWMAKTCSSEDA